MKKFIFLILLFFGVSKNVEAQYVTIPNPNFVIFLQTNYPTCMNGNQMDTTCIEIITEDTLIISYPTDPLISNLVGIQYFDGLISLQCSNNTISYIPTFPSLLERIDCSSNQLITMPNLPSNLRFLDCSSNQLTSLPILPNSLKTLKCEYNDVLNLPILPNLMTYLNC